MSDLVDEGDVLVELPYLARSELYTRQKPYAVDFSIDDIPGAVKSNHAFEPHKIVVQNAGSIRHMFNLEVNGFCFLREQINFTTEDADVPEKVFNQYFHQVGEILRRNFPEYVDFVFMDYEVPFILYLISL